MSGAAITFDNVSKSYPLYHHVTGGFKHFILNLPKGIRSLKHSRFSALCNISFEIARGETFGIIGRNGAGKSTTLGLIAGVLSPSQGKVTVNGRISPLLELGAGFHPELTGRENIMLNGVLMGLLRVEVLRKVNEIIAFSELGDFIDQPIRMYSSGMLARLGFSVVSHLYPEILLIDEILAVGDIEFQKKCIDKMMDFKKKGVTMVLVSHFLDSIKMMCDKTLWIENHVIRMLGSTEQVVDDYVKSHTV